MGARTFEDLIRQHVATDADCCLAHRLLEHCPRLCARILGVVLRKSRNVSLGARDGGWPSFCRPVLILAICRSPMHLLSTNRIPFHLPARSTGTAPRYVLVRSLGFLLMSISLRHQFDPASHIQILSPQPGMLRGNRLPRAGRRVCLPSDARS